MTLKSLTSYLFSAEEVVGDDNGGYKGFYSGLEKMLNLVR